MRKESIIMNLIKKYLSRVFIDGLSGMAMGWFATLIIGTIIQQIGTFAGGSVGNLIFLAGKAAAAATCAGIGVGVAYKFKESPLVVLSAATCGLVGGYASKILAGTFIADGTIVLAGPGEPLGGRQAHRTARRGLNDRQDNSNIHNNSTPQKWTETAINFQGITISRRCPGST